MWHLLDEQNEEVYNVDREIHKRDLDDPIGLWFLGLSLLQNQNKTQQGLKMMGHGIERRIERFIPVEDELKKQLGFKL